MEKLARLVALSGVATLVSTLALAQDPTAALKGRTTAPKEASFDRSATLAGLLTKTAPGAWSTEKGAVIEGYVIQSVKSDDGDYRISLAARPGEADAKKWVIIEATPAWQAKEPTLAETKLSDRGLIGKKVRATGWLFYDNTEVSFPRGTNWEVHPLTSLATLEK